MSKFFVTDFDSLQEDICIEVRNLILWMIMDALRPAVMLCAWGTSISAHYFPLFSDDFCTDCVRKTKVYFGSDRWPTNTSNQ